MKGHAGSSPVGEPMENDFIAPDSWSEALCLQDEYVRTIQALDAQLGNRLKRYHAYAAGPDKWAEYQEWRNRVITKKLNTVDRLRRLKFWMGSRDLSELSDR